jgi:hypothetical protein
VKHSPNCEGPGLSVTECKACEADWLADIRARAAANGKRVWLSRMADTIDDGPREIDELLEALV